MDSSQRVNLFKQSLEKAVNTSEEIVIFETAGSGKIVQFAVQAGEGLMWVDVPIQSLSQKQYNWLLPHMVQMHASTGELLSLQKEIKTVHTQYAAEYTEWIFTKIFQFPDTVDVTAQVFT